MSEHFQKSHMHIFNVSITTVQGLKNESLKVWEELITQSTVKLVLRDHLREVMKVAAYDRGGGDSE
jgi:hypothetical protein